MSKNSLDCREPLVSVVMASYNYGRYIAQAIESVLCQTYSNWELIIIDDGSTDNTKDVVNQFLKDDDRVHYFYQENQGQPKAKNKGIEMSRGELVAFLDADDAWTPLKIEKQIPLFRTSDKIGVTYTGLYIMDENGAIIKTLNCKKHRGMVFKDSFHQTIPAFSSSMVLKSVFDDVGGFNESIPLAIDFELWLRVSMKYEFDYINEPLLIYRTGHANLSKRYRERRKIVSSYIIPHILYNCGGKDLLTKTEIAEAYGKLYFGMGRDDPSGLKKNRIRYFLLSLLKAPWLIEPWKGLLREFIPDIIAKRLKQLFKTRLS